MGIRKQFEITLAEVIESCDSDLEQLFFKEKDIVECEDDESLEELISKIIEKDEEVKIE